MTKYISTRGKSEPLNFETVITSGLAPDGGLYIPNRWPSPSKEYFQEITDLPYYMLASEVISMFSDYALDERDIHNICFEAYKNFTHSDIAPLRQISNTEWLLELFYGPTFAFKDYAMQLLGRLFEWVLQKQDRHITIVGATTGDTGPSAMEAFKNSKYVSLYILYPKGRVSDVQRRQMTTIDSPNVHAVEIDGTFDDCQDIVKALFKDEEFNKDYNLSAVNSINWVRIATQVVYYLYAGFKMNIFNSPIAFAVPTGNFGNVYAGYVASKMGFPIDKLIIGSNANNILPRFFKTGEMRLGEVISTLSPAIDIQIASNFERFLYDLCSGDTDLVTKYMTELRTEGYFKLNDEVMGIARENFTAESITDIDTETTIKNVYHTTGIIIDPHTAVALCASRKTKSSDNVRRVIVSTAHPVKFQYALSSAMGISVKKPDSIKNLCSLKEEFVSLPVNLNSVKTYIENNNGK